MYYIVGLGNPGGEYEKSRHNTGRISVEAFRKKNKIDDFEKNKKLNAFVSSGNYNKQKIQLILPETFMNKSGLSLKSVITSKKKAENLIIVHDDVDIPIGKFKISFGKNSGGHKGIDSVIRSIKTKDFIRIRIGISPFTSSGKIKKVRGKKMLDFIIEDFKPKEIQILKNISKKIISAIETIIDDSVAKAMSIFN